MLSLLLFLFVFAKMSRSAQDDEDEMTTTRRKKQQPPGTKTGFPAVAGVVRNGTKSII